MQLSDLIAFAISVLTILNPLGNATLFEGMVAGRSEAERRSIILRSTLAVCVILVTTVWLGEQLLSAFGISIASLEVAGGLLIAMIALSMVHSSKSQIHSVDEKIPRPEAAEDIAIVPLSIPIIAGPGAIATVMVATQKSQGLTANLTMSLICIGGACFVGLSLLAAAALQRLIGAKGMDVVAKLMGMVLLAIAVGMIATGVGTLFPGLLDKG